MSTRDNRVLKLRPSSAITVRSDTSIGEVVRIMRERKVGSMLVTSAAYPHNIIGIFTERDLVVWVHEINSGGHWDKPIATVMSKNITTLHITEIDRAPEIMVKNNIRHLPIVYSDEDKVVHLAGVISMRDLFRRFVRGEEPARELAKGITPVTKNANVTRIAVISNDKSAQAAIDGMVKQSKRYAMQSIEFSDLVEAVEGGRDLPELDILIFDIDWIQSDRWGFLLKKVLKKDEGPKILLVYDPLLHPKNELAAIETLSAFERFRALPKPLNLLDFFKRLRIWSSVNG